MRKIWPKSLALVGEVEFDGRHDADVFLKAASVAMVLTHIDDNESTLAGMADSTDFGSSVFGEFCGCDTGIASGLLEHVGLDVVEPCKAVTGCTVGDVHPLGHELVDAGSKLFNESDLIGFHTDGACESMILVNELIVIISKITNGIVDNAEFDFFFIQAAVSQNF